MDLSAKIEAVLFWKGEPMQLRKLAEIFKVSKEEVGEAVTELSTRLSGRGIILLVKEDEVTLGTSPEVGSLIEELQKEELNKDLSKASLETLSIILYKNGASRSEIDYIRGVNSSFILRALAVRGLVEKATDTKDSRKFIYKPTFELMSFMGIKTPDELPDFNPVNESIEKAAEELSKQEPSE